MQHQEFKAPDELKNVIRCFWYESRDFGVQPSDHEVVPDGYAEVIFHFGSGCSFYSNEGLKALPSPFMIGLLNQPIIFHAKNTLKVIGVRCYPWAVFDLLSIPAGKGGVRLFEHPIAALQPALKKLVEAGRINEALAIVKQYFLNEHSEFAIEETLSKAGFAMSKAKGSIPVSEIADKAHATVRTLERKFKQSSGYTVKDVSGLMRFEQVRNHLWHYPAGNLAGLAVELGYADQAHLSKEFKRYSGTTPAAFARKAKERKKILNNSIVNFI